MAAYSTQLPARTTYPTTSLSPIPKRALLFHSCRRRRSIPLRFPSNDRHLVTLDISRFVINGMGVD